MQTIRNFPTWFSKQKLSGKLAIGCGGLVGLCFLYSVIMVVFFPPSLPLPTPVPPTTTSLPPTITPVPPTPTAPSPRFDGLITFKDGVQKTYTNLRTHFHSFCGDGTFYMDTSTETDVDRNFIPLFTGEYEVDVPFEIIQKVEVKDPSDSSDGHSIVLSDGTVIQGRVVIIDHKTDITLFGYTDQATYQIPIDSISEITPVYKPSASFIASSPGTNSAILSLQDGTELKLENAIFFSFGYNRNNCFTGDHIYADSMIFERTDDLYYEMTWETVKSVTFVEEWREQFKITTAPVGIEYSGRVTMSNGIEGTATFGNYILNVRVPFFPFLSAAKGITFIK